MTKGNEPSEVAGDAPLTSSKDDEFGLTEMTKGLAATLASRTPVGGYTLGIEGPWGSGKSTFANFVVEELRQSNDQVIIRFEPWLIGEKSALIASFLGSFAAEIDKVTLNQWRWWQYRRWLGFWPWGRLSNAIRKYGGYLNALSVPVGAAATVDPTGSTAGHFGRLDILVNNAGWNIGIPFGELDALTPEIWDRVLETNLRGPFLLTRALASELRRHKAGRVINIASLAGIAPGGSSIAYAASKAALIHLTHCLAVALAPDVTVNCVAPGLVEGTRMAERVPEATKQMARALSVLGRTGSADDIAQMVVGYCRTESVTGQTVVVDGGNPMGMR